MAEKKKQHYVPKVYLKYFALDGKTINLFHIETQNLYTSIPFNSQFKDKYYYSPNLIVENALGVYENTFDNAFYKVKASMELNNCDFKIIMTFALLQKHRTDKNIKPIKDIVKKQAKVQFKLLNPDISNDFINESFDKYWEEHYDKSNEFEYEATLNFISNLLNDEKFSEYNITILNNSSGVGFISSDNPVCMINIEECQLVETGALVSNNIMFFSLGFEKLVIIYRKEVYKINKKSLNSDDVLAINKLIALNADKQLILPLSFSESKIKHWLSNLKSKTVDTNAKPIIKRGNDIMFEFAPRYIEHNIKLKFISKI